MEGSELEDEVTEYDLVPLDDKDADGDRVDDLEDVIDPLVDGERVELREVDNVLLSFGDPVELVDAVIDLLPDTVVL